MSNVFIRENSTLNYTKETKWRKRQIRVMLHKPRNVRNNQKWKSLRKIDTWAFTGSLDQSKTWMSGLQNCEKVNFYCFNTSKLVLISYGDPSNLIYILILFFYFYFYFSLISWRLITLQYCSGFCHTLKWISHGFRCAPHPDPPSHLPLHPIPLGLASAPGPSTCLMHPTWAGDLFHPR